MLCGSARIEITPPFKTELFGYPEPSRICEPNIAGVLDSLQARTLYLQIAQDDAVLLVVLDLCLLHTADADHLRSAIAEKTGLPAKRVLIACTHTHSAPLAAIQERPGLPLGAADFGRWILPRIVEAACRATARPFKVTPRFRETLTGLGYDRRCPGNHGIRNCWNIDAFPERQPQPARHAVHSVLYLQRMDKPGGILLHSAPLHPVVMGRESELISADWPGACRRLIERRMAATRAITTQGASAQVQPWISCQTDTRGLRIVGEAVAGEAIQLALTGRELVGGPASFNLREVPIGASGSVATFFEIGEVLMAFLPLELSTRLLARVRERICRPSMLTCLANGWSGYWMDASEFAEGGYEVEVARRNGRRPEDSEALLEVLTYDQSPSIHATQVS